MYSNNYNQFHQSISIIPCNFLPLSTPARQNLQITYYQRVLLRTDLKCVLFLCNRVDPMLNTRPVHINLIHEVCIIDDYYPLIHDRHVQILLCDDRWLDLSRIQTCSTLLKELQNKNHLFYVLRNISIKLQQRHCCRAVLNK